MSSQVLKGEQMKTKTVFEITHSSSSSYIVYFPDFLTFDHLKNSISDHLYNELFEDSGVETEEYFNTQIQNEFESLKNEELKETHDEGDASHAIFEFILFGFLNLGLLLRQVECEPDTTSIVFIRDHDINSAKENSEKLKGNYNNENQN